MDQIQKEIDADGNGEIDFEEFLSIMKSDLLRYVGQPARIIRAERYIRQTCIFVLLERCSLWTTGRGDFGQLSRRLRVTDGKLERITSFDFSW